MKTCLIVLLTLTLFAPLEGKRKKGCPKCLTETVSSPIA